MERNTRTRTRDRNQGRVRPGSQKFSIAVHRRQLGQRQREAIEIFQKWDRRMILKHGRLYHQTQGYTVH